MRWLRSFGDVAIGAQTVREQPALVLTPEEPGDEPAPELYRFRYQHGLPEHPRSIVYSLFGRLPLAHPIFARPELGAIVVTTEPGAIELRGRAGDRTPPLVVDRLLEPDGLRHAHETLFAERGVRYLACEGGETALAALRRAGLLDEVFLTVTDVVVDAAAHDGVQRIIDLAGEGATLVAEGRVAADPGWRFQRWRFSAR
jgi:riboflavin biosynthesis pyrimidine reductase